MTNFIIILAQKPIKENFAFNCANYGCGGLNIPQCRIEITPKDAQAMERCNTPNSGRFGVGKFGHIYANGSGTTPSNRKLDTSQGRWPANLIHDNHDDIIILFPFSNSKRKIDSNATGKKCKKGNLFNKKIVGMSHGDKGSAARFFKSFTK